MQPHPNARDLFAEALTARAAGDADGAARLLDQLLQSAPRHIGALMLLAELREARGNVRAAVPLLDAALALAPNNSAAWTKHGALLSHLGKWADALRSFERALAIDPTNAAAVTARSQALLSLGRYQDAIDACDFAIAVGDGGATSFRVRGKALAKLGRFDEAFESLRTAQRRAPNDATPLNDIGALLVEQGRHEEATQAFRAAVKLAPKDASILSNLGWTLSELCRFDEALTVLNAALAARPDHALARWHRGLALLALGYLEEGFRDYEARFRVKDPTFEKLRKYAAPLWLEGESIEGKTLLLYCGQGNGDTIQFARFAPVLQARGAKIVLEVQPGLKRLLTGLWPGVDIVAQGEVLPHFDLFCPIMSVPVRLNTSLKTIPSQIPYLHADPMAVNAWRQRLAPLPGRKVGLAWAGNPRHSKDAGRSIALETLAPILKAKGVSFVSLQKDLRPGDREILERADVLDATAELHDFADTAALVSNLDLVIAVDSAIAHLSGALGRPLWMLTPAAPDWRWLLERTDSPWYPTARLIRQERTGDWTSAVARVSAALADLGARTKP